MTTAIPSPLPSRRAAVIVSSDRAHEGTYEDLSGPAARGWLHEHGFEVEATAVVPDTKSELVKALEKALTTGPSLIVISGGTGLGPRDITPQVLDDFCDYDIPGFGELLRRESLKFSLNAYLSRCGGWIKDRTLVLALPGNPKAVVEQLGILADLLPHAVKSLSGKCDHRRKVEP